MPLEHFGPIESGDKIERIIGLLKRLILEGKLLPGTEIPAERELAARLNVSRYSLREALRGAEARGLVELRQGKRPRIRAPSSDSVAEVFDIAVQRSKVRLTDLIAARMSIECDIAAVVAQHADATLIRRLEQSIEELRLHSDDLSYCADKDLEFHNELVVASGNPVFKIMLDSVAYHLRTSRLATIRLTGVSRAVVGHMRIVRALKNNDSQAAHAAMHEHLDMAAEDIRKLEEKHGGTA